MGTRAAGLAVLNGRPGRPEVLFQDKRFLVLNKPAGLPVHAGPRHARSIEDWLPARAWLAHRLDADTAGCLLVALKKSALLAAQAEFATARVERLYWAVVEGGPAETQGRIMAPLAKRNGARGWRIEVAADGQAAVTEWQVLGRGDGLTWLALRPVTGRTHQLRVHCAHQGWPIVGDALYGRADDGLMLLARYLRLALDPPVAAEAPVPAPMRPLLARVNPSGV